MLPLSSSLRSKKLFHKRDTFIGHQSFNDNSFRMQSRTGIFLIATFLIFGAKHKSARLCPGDSSGTHHTGFNCDIQSTFIEKLKRVLDDTYFMKQALMEARKAAERGEVPVGAVVVCKERIIARAHNLTETLNDVTAHAEMQAITAAANVLGGKYLNEPALSLIFNHKLSSIVSYRAHRKGSDNLLPYSYG